MLPLVPYRDQVRAYAFGAVPDGRLLKYVAYYRRVDGFRQKPPYNIDTRFSLLEGRRVQGKALYGPSADAIPMRELTVEGMVGVTNKARERFVKKLGDASQLGSTGTSERKASWATIVGGVTTGLRAAKFVAKGDLLEAGRLLRFNPPVVRKVVRRTTARKRGKKRKVHKVFKEYWVMPDTRLVAKSLANRWLWYSYGVKPLVEDLYNASEVFTREIPGTRVQGKASERWSEPAPYNDQYHSKGQVIVAAYVRVKSPDLWLANQLGLLNPIQWFNEGIMFSFVIDWFSNWSAWLQQLTDFIGLEIVNPSTFSKLEVINQQRFYGDLTVTQWVNVERVLQIPAVKLRFAYERFEWQRGLNAISLLVGFLGKQPR